MNRFILGIAGGFTSVAGYSYVVELPDTCIRGNMATMPTLGIVIGNMLTVAIGYSLPWHYLCLFGLIPPIIFFLATIYLPESPSFLVIKGHRQQAITILRKLRGKYANVEAEVSELERRNMTGGAGCRGLFERDVLKRVGVVTFLFLTSQMCGNFVFMIYTARYDFQDRTGMQHGYT